MDSIAFDQLHASLADQGFRGDPQLLADLLSRADADTRERHFLSAWPARGASVQRKFLLHVFAHARKHDLKVVYAEPVHGVVTLTSLRSDHGVRLGRLEIDKQKVRCGFYRDNDQVGERSYTWPLKDRAAKPSRKAWP